MDRKTRRNVDSSPIQWVGQMMHALAAVAQWGSTAPRVVEGQPQAGVPGPIARSRAARSLPLRPTLWRLFWVLMLLAHAPALGSTVRSFVSAGLTGERLASCLLLGLAVVFFALKAIDIALLRFQTTRRSFVALCMVAALLHLDTIRPADAPTFLPEATALVATTCFAGSLEPVQRKLNAALSRFASASSRHQHHSQTRDIVLLEEFHPRCWTLAHRLFLLRAPPV